MTGENAGYLVLLASEQLAASPRRVELATVSLTPEGAVRVAGDVPASEARAEVDLRALLAQLLDVASSPGPALARVATRSPAGSLRALENELAKALIPVNRAASGRALRRLYRETERAAASDRLAPPPDLPQPPRDEAPAAEPLEPPPVEDASEQGAASGLEAPVPPPVAELPANVAMAAVSAAHAGVGRLPERVDEQTRPETVAALRHFGVAARAPSELPGAPSDVGRGAATPPLGSVVVSTETVVAPGRGELDGVVRDVEVTERAPAVFDEAPETGAATPGWRDPGAWPVELASEAAALPLEPERDALPPPPPQPEPEIVLESPLIVPTAPLPLELRAAPIFSRPTPLVPPPLEVAPEAPPEPYPGLSPERSDVRQLLSGFRVAGGVGEKDLQGELKRLAGIEETPGHCSAYRRR